MINVTLKNVKLAFNQNAIIAPADRFQVKLLNQMGGLTRKISRRSIRPATSKRQISQPGQPPVTHRGRINYRDTIFYVVDAKAKTMVCGAVLLLDTDAAGQTVPGILEKGGVVMRLNRRTFQRKPASIRERPHMAPAFAKAIETKLPDLIAGGIMREV